VTRIAVAACLAAGSQARSKATKSIPCALGRALHGGMRSGDDDVTHDDGVTHTGTRSKEVRPSRSFFLLHT
jgi:hypothetical protein